ncbi:MAG TPA: SRPBCC family protein [Vicinamibacterales bacterium]|nr:SRPBCC family protein [Vicinamibacterales bacterium]
MSVTIHTEHDLGSAPDAVWRVMQTFAAYPDWNPLHRRLELDGPFCDGTPVRITMKMDAFTFRHRARLTDVDPAARQFAWVAQVGHVPGLYVVYRRFRIEGAPGGSRLIQHEVGTGPVAAVLFAGGFMLPRVERAFGLLAAAVDRRAALSTAGPAGAAPRGEASERRGVH